MSAPSCPENPAGNAGTSGPALGIAMVATFFKPLIFPIV